MMQICHVPCIRSARHWRHKNRQNYQNVIKIMTNKTKIWGEKEVSFDIKDSSLKKSIPVIEPAAESVGL